MSINKRHLNIPQSNELDQVLTKLADRDAVPQATKANKLIQLALEIEEDQVWNSIVQSRDTKNAKYISHELVQLD